MLVAGGLVALGVELGLRVVYPLADPFAHLKTVARGAYVPARHAPNHTLEIVPEAGLPGVEGRRTFRTNPQGFVGPDLDTAGAAPRVFLLGGSTMEAVVLGTDGNPAPKLQAHLRRSGVEAVVENAAHSGDASFDHIAMLAHRVVHLSPRVVVVWVGVNDLIAGLRGEDYAHAAPDHVEVLDAPNLARLAATETQLGRLAWTAMGAGRWRRDEPRVRTRYGAIAAACAGRAVHPEAPRVDLDGYARNLRTLAAVAEAHGIDVVWVTQPHSWAESSGLEGWHWLTCHRGRRYAAPAMAAALARYDAVTRRVAAETGGRLVDLARTLPGDATHLYDDVHLNDGGVDGLVEALGPAVQAVLTATVSPSRRGSRPSPPPAPR